MNHTRVLTNTISDNTGKVTQIPILLIEKDGEINPLWPLHRYLMIKSHTRSISWQNKLIQVVGLLLDYMEANKDCFPNPKDLFKAFTDTVYAGTINEDGYDPSGLFWLPRRTKTARQLLVPLSIFSDWMHTEYGSIPLNPWREATAHEERLNWAALIQKSHRSFLGHLDDPNKMSETAKKVRDIVERRIPSGDYGDVKAFPKDTILNLLWVGFKKSNKENNFLKQYNWRDIAITILMHGGGLRESEPFHLWVHDVFPEPSDPSFAIVRVYHPSEGDAPKDFKMPDGKPLNNRKAYLAMKYGLKPRNEYHGLRHAGWKDPRLSDNKQYYIHVHWFPRSWGYLFMQVWKMYLAQRIYEKISDTHPFAFVSFRGDSHGNMYTTESFRQSHARAVRKIGLTVGKMLGTTEHGHRHAYGQITTEAGLDPAVKQAGLHHKARESQDVYTQPTIDRITKELAKASQALENGQQLPMVVDIDAWFNQERKKQKFWIQRKGNRNGEK